MFDRSVIAEGRRIQDFGLCDLNGVYQLTAKLRAKGWLAVTFFSPSDSHSKAVIEILKDWAATLPGDKFSAMGVLQGERSDLEAYKAKPPAFPVVWDIEGYWAANWGLTALPTTFITDTNGRVLTRVIGADTSALSAAKTELASLIEKAAAAAKAAADAAAAAAASAPAPGAPAPAAAPAPVAAAPAPVPAAVAAPAPAAKFGGPAKGKSKK